MPTPIKDNSRRMWWAFIALIILSLLNFYLVIFTHNAQYPSLIPIAGKPGTQGLKGEPGNSGQMGISVTGLKGDTGLQGAQGVQGLQGAVGTQGPQGTPGDTGSQGPAGPPGGQGEPGQNGRQVEFRCDPANNDYEYRYVGDNNWTIIERDSNACKSTPL